MARLRRTALAALLSAPALLFCGAGLGFLVEWEKAPLRSSEWKCRRYLAVERVRNRPMHERQMALESVAMNNAKVLLAVFLGVATAGLVGSYILFANGVQFGGLACDNWLLGLSPIRLFAHGVPEMSALLVGQLYVIRLLLGLVSWWYDGKPPRCGAWVYLMPLAASCLMVAAAIVEVYVSPRF